MYATQRRTLNTAASSANDTTASTTPGPLTALQVVNATASQAFRSLPPQSVINEVVVDIRNPALRRFLEDVLHEPLIHGLITLPLVRHGQPVQFPIQIIRRVGLHLSAAQARTQQEKDLVLVATVLWGVRSLLPLSIYGKTALQDVFTTLIRSALHVLDDSTYEVSMVLRGLLGLGDDASEQCESVPHLHRQIQRAVSEMHQRKHWLLHCMQEAIARQTTRGMANLAERAACQ